jgi:NTE family protein
MSFYPRKRTSAAEWGFVTMLREEGRHAASEFLKAHADDLGRRSTADIDVLLTEC